MEIIFLFIVGLSIGSFVNVLVDRLPKNQEIIFGRSRCDFCRKKLAFFDLIPVLSFLILRGRCRYCTKKLSWQYPLVELAAGILFVSVYAHLRLADSPVNIFRLIYTLAIFSGLAALVVTDIKFMIIPDQVLVFLVISSFTYQLIFVQGLIMANILAGVTAFLGFLILVIITRGSGMGLGDVKLAFFMGLFLGFPKIVTALYLAFLTGASISLILIILGKKKLKSTIAFGPFLCISAGISYLYGSEIWQYIIKIMGI